MDRFIVFTRIDFVNADVSLKSNMDRFIASYTFEIDVMWRVFKIQYG